LELIVNAKRKDTKVYTIAVKHINGSKYIQYKAIFDITVNKEPIY